MKRVNLCGAESLPFCPSIQGNNNKNEYRLFVRDPNAYKNATYYDKTQVIFLQLSVCSIVNKPYNIQISYDCNFFSFFSFPLRLRLFILFLSRNFS